MVVMRESIILCDLYDCVILYIFNVFTLHVYGSSRMTKTTSKFSDYMSVVTNSFNHSKQSESARLSPIENQMLDVVLCNYMYVEIIFHAIMVSIATILLSSTVRIMKTVVLSNSFCDDSWFPLRFCACSFAFPCFAMRFDDTARRSGT